MYKRPSFTPIETGPNLSFTIPAPSKDPHVLCELLEKWMSLRGHGFDAYVNLDCTLICGSLNVMYDRLQFPDFLARLDDLAEFLGQELKCAKPQVAFDHAHLGETVILIMSLSKGGGQFHNVRQVGNWLDKPTMPWLDQDMQEALNVLRFSHDTRLAHLAYEGRRWRKPEKIGSGDGAVIKLTKLASDWMRPIAYAVANAFDQPCFYLAGGDEIGFYELYDGTEAAEPPPDAAKSAASGPRASTAASSSRRVRAAR